MFELYRVRNVGDTPVVLRHHRGDVTIDPLHERTVPAEYAWLNLGDPRVRNLGKDNQRDQMFTQVRTHWGFYPGLMPEAQWDEMKPKVECLDLDGKRVYMMIDDPDGSLGLANGLDPTAAQSDAVELSAQTQVIASMRSEMTQLREMVAALLATQAGAPNVGPATQVGETPAPVDAGTPASVGGFDPATMAILAQQAGAAVGAQQPIEPVDGDALNAGAGVEPLDPSLPRNAEPRNAEGTSQADRNERSAEIPKPAADEPPVTADSPRTTRLGPPRA